MIKNTWLTILLVVGWSLASHAQQYGTLGPEVECHAYYEGSGISSDSFVVQYNYEYDMLYFSPLNGERDPATGHHVELIPATCKGFIQADYMMEYKTDANYSYNSSTFFTPAVVNHQVGDYYVRDIAFKYTSTYTYMIVEFVNSAYGNWHREYFCNGHFRPIYEYPYECLTPHQYQ